MDVASASVDDILAGGIFVGVPPLGTASQSPTPSAGGKKLLPSSEPRSVHKNLLVTLDRDVLAKDGSEANLAPGNGHAPLLIRATGRCSSLQLPIGKGCEILTLGAAQAELFAPAKDSPHAVLVGSLGFCRNICHRCSSSS